MAYKINIQYLESKGFKKNDLVDNADERLWIWRDEERTLGFNLLYLEEHGVLTIVETFLKSSDNANAFDVYMINRFVVKSDEDLKFIFTRLTYLNFCLNSSNHLC